MSKLIHSINPGWSNLLPPDIQLLKRSILFENVNGTIVSNLKYVKHLNW
ncbi:MAG: hypothetical protein HKM87_01160 [Ignavibacteriaceae bacterium]|nr:hypothetical protein [Ignavibacteriaceae bacterium]